MPRRDRARDGKREQILEGAIHAFAEGGFHGTRVADVARAAGVADGTIYLYFRNKDELLASVFERAMDRFHRAGEDEVLAAPDAAAQLDRLVEMHLRLLGEDRRLAAVFQIDLRHSQRFLGEISRRVLRPHLEFIARIVERGQADGSFDPELSPEESAGMIFGVLDQLATSWVLSRRNYRLDSKTASAQRFLRQALMTGPPE